MVAAALINKHWSAVALSTSAWAWRLETIPHTFIASLLRSRSWPSLCWLLKPANLLPPLDLECLEQTCDAPELPGYDATDPPLKTWEHRGVSSNFLVFNVSFTRTHAWQHQPPYLHICKLVCTNRPAILLLSAAAGKASETLPLIPTHLPSTAPGMQFQHQALCRGPKMASGEGLKILRDALGRECPTFGACPSTSTLPPFLAAFGEQPKAGPIALASSYGQSTTYMVRLCWH